MNFVLGVASGMVFGAVLGWLFAASRVVAANERRRRRWHVAVRPSWHDGARVEVRRKGNNDVLVVQEIKSKDENFSERLAEARAVAEDRASDLNAMEV